MATGSDICLYNLTLKRQSKSIRSCCGNFSEKKSQEIITASSNSLTVYKADSNEGKLNKLVTIPVFAIIRSILNFKIAGSGKDYLVVTSDSGNLSILEFELEKLSFKTVFNEPYAKSGIRRLSPGFDLAADAKGRAIIATALEKNKLCYVMNRDLDNNLTISSPLEANRSKILTLETIGLDVGYENPLFASIEIDYSDYEDSNVVEYQRWLTYYELDLGLNHVLRKHSEKVDNCTNFLLQVPGGSDGPSGVLCCAKNRISYKNPYFKTRLAINIPQLDGDETDVFVTSGVVHKMKNKFFFIVQTNLGDLFKVEVREKGELSLAISYFDSIPIASSLIILKSGFLFADTEHGDKMFYQFENLGSDDPFISNSDTSLEKLTFTRNEELDNLLLVDIIESLNPLLDAKLTSDATSTSIYALSGVEKSSSLRVLQYGVSINEIVESELPPLSDKVFTTTTQKSDEFDSYLIISFVNTTLVLSIGESVEEVTDSGIALDEHTLDIQQIGDNSIAQVHTNGIRLIKDGKVSNEWLPPAGIKIVCSSTTSKQVAIALSNDELVYFEVDEYDRLIEYSERKEFQSRITSVSLGEIPEGKLRSPFLVIGCVDSTIRILNTAPANTLDSMSLQALNSVPSDLLISSMNGQIYVNIGLDNGVYVRTLLDERTGSLSDTRTKYLGSRPVKLNRVRYQDQNIVLAFSDSTWVIHELKSFQIAKLLVDNLQYGAAFNSEHISNGVVGIHQRKLTIFQIQDPLEPFNINSIELKTTPKRLSNFENHLFVTERHGGSSIIEKIDASNGEIEETIYLEPNTSIISSEIVRFESREFSPYLLVSLAKDYKPQSNQFAESWIYAYDLDLKLINKTKFTDLIYAITEFQGKVLIGVNNHLRLFDIGLKQLLSKCSSRIDSITQIVRLETQGYRVYVADIRESITYCVYNPDSNDFISFVDDVLARHVTSFKTLDYYTVIVGDKFGNISLLRCDEEISDLSDKSTTFLTSQGSYLNGAPKKLANLTNFFIEDIPTSFNVDSLTAGGQEVVVYTGIQGTIGTMIPIQARSDIRFFNKLQKSMRVHVPDLLGRDNLKYRGYYQPVKNVIDGDLIELYNGLPTDVKVRIGKEVGKLPKDIIRKIFEIRALSI